MTCIVGLEHDGHVYMGGDSASASGWDVNRTRLNKVFKIGEIIIGYTSSFRMGQLLQYGLKLDKQTCGDDLEYMATTFIDAVRECLGEGGYKKVDNNRESGGIFLVGYRGIVYSVYSDFQVNSSSDGYTSCGAGESFALGSLFETIYCEPEERIERALVTAAHFSGGVCSPFIVISSKE